jgi:3'(2'), 5'-bisphosphate nucleotidase
MMDRVIHAAKEAGRVIQTHYKTQVRVELKSDRSPITLADREAHDILVRRMHDIDSQIPLISEEGEYPSFEIRRKWKTFWLVDPLDGTRDFLDQNDEFTVNIALIKGQTPVLGVIFAPALNKLYYAEEGKGAWRVVDDQKPQRIFSSKPTQGQKPVLALSRHHGRGELKAMTKKWGELTPLVMGSSLKFCAVAEGTAHGYIRFSPTMEWDVAAGDCIWRQARNKGSNPCELTYNKASLKNEGFSIGYLK